MEPARINTQTEEIKTDLNDRTSYTEDDYYNLPNNTRAELINGKFYDMAAPSRLHQEIISFFTQKIKNYIESNDGSCKVYPAPFAVKLFNNKKTIVEPDISVICDRNKLTDQGCSGAPDWIVEVISPSNSAHDYVRKLNLYASAGVREYWIIDPLCREVSVYLFEKSPFPVSYTFDDKVPVGIYDDFRIDFQEFEKTL